MRLLRFARNDEFQGLINEIASAFSKPRNDEFQGLINEIASVALLPRNDAENSRIP